MTTSRRKPPSPDEVEPKHVKYLLETRNMTQEELAAKIGSHKSQISRFISGERGIGRYPREKLAKLLGWRES